MSAGDGARNEMKMKFRNLNVAHHNAALAFACVPLPFLSLGSDHCALAARPCLDGLALLHLI